MCKQKDEVENPILRGSSGDSMLFSTPDIQPYIIEEGNWRMWYQGNSTKPPEPVILEK
jgi:hypothetical protein